MKNKEKELLEIDQTQNFYVKQLIDMIEGINPTFNELREINFTSPTGTGKTVMVAKLINLLPNYFFVVTTLSRGQLRVQIENKIKSLAEHNNFIVYGLNEYTTKTHLQQKDIISHLPNSKSIIWIRDEGHIATNRWQEVLKERATHIINFSATNKYSNGIQCNFTHTMMLRTVNQNVGTPGDALNKLQEIKMAHSQVQNYNPCALFRLFHDSNVDRVIDECEKRGLKYKNVTSESFDMEDICRDNNEYDVIINKLKITEGIDLKRCHVIYMDTKPSNEATVVQIIGRARRNALFWRSDIDILAKENEKLLEQTRSCYVYYNIPETKIEQNENGELSFSLCDVVSIEKLKPDTNIYVKNGQMRNGLKILELDGKTGVFHISVDPELNFNVVNCDSFYKIKRISTESNILDMSKYETFIQRIGFKDNILEYFRTRKLVTSRKYDINKYWYYLFKIKLQKEAPSIIYELERLNFESRSKMNDKYHLCDENVLRSIFYNLNIYFDYMFFRRANHESYSKEERMDAYKKSIIIPPPLEEKKWVFEKNYENFRKVSREFLKYVEWVEYYDFSPYRKLEKFLNHSDNIIQLDANNYKVFSHPLTDYLKYRDVCNLKDLEAVVFACKGRTVLKANVNLWKKMLSEINKFEEIDNYDGVIVDLYSLNQKFNLGLSKKEMDAIINSNYQIIRASAEEFAYEYIYYFDKSTRTPKKYTRQLFIQKSDIDSKYKSYSKVINDREIAIIGPDNMKYSSGIYVEDKSVSSKIDCYCKFSRFIESRYKKEFESCKHKLFNGKNDFEFDRICNSCLGFCVEYYSKMIVYGDSVFQSFINDAMNEMKTKEINDVVRVRAAILAYKYEMKCCFGEKTSSVIPTISIEKLVQDNYQSFLSKVIELGNRTAEFIKKTLYFDNPNPAYNIDPVLSVNHISALCDFISEDTIVDLKCTSAITTSHIKQVLAYHYLSTKRDDINIKKVIVYEAVTNRSVVIDLNGALNN